jgi:Ricin-type beta-trefoil lectin domain-like
MRNPVRKLAILAAPLVLLTSFAAQAPSANAATAVALYESEAGNPATLPCLVYSNGALYLQGGCSTTDPAGLNHVALWDEISEPAQGNYPTFELKNVHISECLTSTSTGPGVYMATCGSNHVQWWEIQPLGNNEYNIVNAHTSYGLDLDFGACCFYWQIS